MGMIPRFEKRTPIGIDLGSRSIKAVQLARSGSTWRMHAAINLPLPIPDHPIDEHTARHLREVLYRHGFVGDRVVLAASEKCLAVETLELPPRSSGAPVEQIARMEMARASKLESQPFEMGCWDLPTAARAGAGTSLMAVALRHKDAAALLDPFDAEGFHVVAVDARCCALARACKPYDTSSSTTALLDMGWNSATIVLVRDGIVLYQRALNESGLALLSRAIADEFGLAEDEVDYVVANVGAGVAECAEDLKDLAQSGQIRKLIARYLDSMVPEIDAAFQYALHRYPQTPVGQLLLIGGGSRIAGAPALLALRLDLQAVSVLSPATVVTCSEELATRYPDGVLTTALGLAWNGVK